MSDVPGIESVMLAEARAEVGAADHKASMVLAALGIGFGALIGGLLARDWKPSDLSGAGEIFWWIGAVFALASVGSAGHAVWPRYSARDIGDGIYFWGHVATFNSVDSLRAALKKDKSDANDRTIHQLWNLSKSCARSISECG